MPIEAFNREAQINPARTFGDLSFSECIMSIINDSEYSQGMKGGRPPSITYTTIITKYYFSAYLGH